MTQATAVVSAAPAPPHRERLRVPMSWWLLGFALVVPVAAALGIYYLDRWQLLAFVVLASAALAAVLWLGGSAAVVADDTGLRAGDYQIEWEHVGTAVPHGAEATRTRLGVQADATAALVVRPFVTTSVEVEIVDPGDPHPYWLISSRHPTALAAAINARAGTTPTAAGEGRA